MKTMTVGELREALAGLSDDTKVCFRKWSYEQEDQEFSPCFVEGTALVPTSAETGELRAYDRGRDTVLEEALVLI